PRPEVLRTQCGEVQQQVADVALGIEDERRDAGEERLLEQHDTESGLAGAGHADDDTVRREFVRLDLEPLAGRLALRVQPSTQMQSAHPSLPRSVPSAAAPEASSASMSASL